jgi:hypothetical protein
VLIAGSEVADVPRFHRQNARLADAHPAAERHLKPTFSPASKSEVAPSDSLVGNRKGDRATLAALVGTGDGEPLHVQVVSQPGVVPHLLDGVQHHGRTACPRRPILPVKHKAAALIEIEVAVVSVFHYRDGRQV